MNRQKTTTILFAVLLLASVSLLGGCQTTTPSTTPTTATTGVIGWDGNSVTYPASAIRTFGSGTPAGTVNYDAAADTATIWNIDASLDNYGGIQTPTLTLDFSKAVIFQMEVLDCFTQYIVKLAVEGESEYYYVLSDTGTTGLISINVADAMLSDKYRAKNTQPDPGYATGWKYDEQQVNCTFHILAKGPDGEKQTAELVLKSISIYNDQTAVTGVEILSATLEEGRLERLKGSDAVTLTATILPDTITDNEVIWSSLDSTIATVDENGTVRFIGVGSTQITATSAIDQSKTASLPVNVTSGYEDVNALKTRLTTLSYAGSTADALAFTDLFMTTWGEDIGQILTAEPRLALSSRVSGSQVTVENYFDASLPAHLTEANGSLSGGKAFLDLTLSGSGSAVLYRNIGGKLYQENYGGTLAVSYASYDALWSKSASYVESGIVVWSDGTVKKYEITVLSTTLIGSYAAADLADAGLWTIPDRTRQNVDAVIHALSPASVNVAEGLATLHQNKYSEAKYCFGGLVSNVLASEPDRPVQIVLDVASLNQMNDYVKTMWEIRILYYQSNGTTVVNSNPLKVASGNTPGLQIITFIPAYDHYRIYLVVNGSDIGAQFADASMQIRSLKLYFLND